MCKENLNSDGQQIHQFLQNEQSPLTSVHRTSYVIQNPGLGIGNAEKCSGDETFIGTAMNKMSKNERKQYNMQIQVIGN